MIAPFLWLRRLLWWGRVVTCRFCTRSLMPLRLIWLLQLLRAGLGTPRLLLFKSLVGPVVGCLSRGDASNTLLPCLRGGWVACCQLLGS